MNCLCCFLIAHIFAANNTQNYNEFSAIVKLCGLHKSCEMNALRTRKIFFDAQVRVCVRACV